MNITFRIAFIFLLLSTIPVSAKDSIRFKHNHFIYYPCNEGASYFVLDHEHTHHLKQNKHKHQLSSRCPYTPEIKRKSIIILQKKLKSLGFYNGDFNGKVTTELIESLKHFELIKEELETNA